MAGLCQWSARTVTCEPVFPPEAQRRSSIKPLIVHSVDKEKFRYKVMSTIEGDYHTLITVLRPGGLHTMYFKVHPDLAHIEGN